MSDDQTARILAIVEGLQASQGKLQASQDKLQAGQNELRADVSKMRAELEKVGTELGTLRVDAMARMDRIQDAVSGLRDDIVVNFGRADRVARHARSTDDQVRALADEVSAMERQIQRLQSDVRTLRGEA